MNTKQNGVKFMKVFLLFICCIGFLFQTACFAGLSDWSYDMQNGYEIWRVNSRSIVCGKSETPSSLSPVAGEYVTKFYYDSQYICLQCVDVPADLSEEIKTDNPMYYIVDVQTDEVIGPLTEAEFDEMIISTQRNGEILWINTVPKPDGAE